MLRHRFAHNLMRDITPGTPAIEVINALEGLDLETADADAIKSMLGDYGWKVCGPHCHECGSECDAVVVMDGDIVDREDGFNICEECLRLALSQICTIKQE